MTRPFVVFCCDPDNRQAPDAAFAAEAEAAVAIGGRYSLVSYESLVDDDDAPRAVRRVERQSAPVTAVYRGWMLTPDQYEALYAALEQRGVRLVNDPAAYRHCHWFPQAFAYAAFRSSTLWRSRSRAGPR